MPKRLGYRGLRRTANRDALMEAAEELFGLHGFSEVSIDEITARAGVAKGTFYNHFVDKSDIANAIALSIREETRQKISVAKSISNDPAQHLAIAMSSFLRMAIDQPNKARILATLLKNPTLPDAPMNVPVIQTIERGVSSGRFVTSSEQSSYVFVMAVVSGGILHFLNSVNADFELQSMSMIIQTLMAFGLTHETATAVAKSRDVTGILTREQPTA